MLTNRKLFVIKYFKVHDSRTVQIMNMEEDNSRKGKLNTPTREEELVVELNFDILKTIQSLQEDLQIFKDDNMNERKEKKLINEALL